MSQIDKAFETFMEALDGAATPCSGNEEPANSYGRC